MVIKKPPSSFSKLNDNGSYTNSLCSIILIVMLSVFGFFHMGSDARRHQLQHNPGDQGNDHHRNQGCRLKDRLGLSASCGDPGENTFKNSHKNLGDGIDALYKTTCRICSHKFENQAKGQYDFDNAEDRDNKTL